ncbi:MAG: ABC transporter substrate-binding protein [Clostridiales bacterium]|nr:ABC transporter substrate-binding protein [Clostridiales bacterium]
MKKSVKKVAALALSGLMIASVFAGCSASSDDTSSADTDTVAKTEFTVGICQLVQHDALDAATQGFQDRLNELAEEGGQTITYDYQNASNDTAACSTIANQFVSDGVDLIMANATPALQACATATASSQIPVVATSITDFGVALFGDESTMAPTDATGINVTGSNDLAPLASQAQQILDLFPDTKVVGCIYCSAEANSKFQVDGVKEALEEQGIECNFYSFADSNDIQSVAQKAASESDVIYIPTDNTAASNGSIISTVCEAAGVPIIAGEEGIFESTNAVATLSISFYEIGQKAGEMAYDILVNGTDPSTMNVWQTENVTYYYNEEMAEKYNVQIPDGYTAYDFSDSDSE